MTSSIAIEKSCSSKKKRGETMEMQSKGGYFKFPSNITERLKPTRQNGTFAGCHTDETKTKS